MVYQVFWELVENTASLVAAGEVTSAREDLACIAAVVVRCEDLPTPKGVARGAKFPGVGGFGTLLRAVLLLHVV